MKAILTLSILLGILSLIGCGDPAPTEYLPQYVVQGYLIVGEPIRNIVVTSSQSVTEPCSRSACSGSAPARGSTR